MACLAWIASELIFAQPAFWRESSYRRSPSARGQGALDGRRYGRIGAVHVVTPFGKLAAIRLMARFAGPVAILRERD